MSFTFLGFFFVVFSKSKQRFCFLATYSQCFKIAIAGNTAVGRSIFHKHKAYTTDESVNFAFIESESF